MSVDLEEFGDPLLWRALMSENTTALPVVVVGAGPIGLAAAAHLIGRGLEPLVVEAGPSAGTAVREWSHVRLFSPWAQVVDPAAEKLLAPTGWVKPDGDAYPSGAGGPGSTFSRSPTYSARRSVSAPALPAFPGPAVTA